MKYTLTIIKRDKNDNYEEEMVKFKENSLYGIRNRNFDSYDQMPQLEKAERALEVTLTEEEYKKVKAEVIKVFE